jgi:hypothetical protein
MLFYPESFKISTPTDREVAVERDFNAPCRLVFDAFTKPELVRRWLLGPDGWTMPVCEIDLRVGGAVMSGATKPQDTKWEWVALSAKSFVPKESSQQRSSITPGTRWGPNRAPTAPTGGRSSGARCASTPRGTGNSTVARGIPSAIGYEHAHIVRLQPDQCVAAKLHEKS